MFRYFPWMMLIFLIGCETGVDVAVDPNVVIRPGAVAVDPNINVEPNAVQVHDLLGGISATLADLDQQAKSVLETAKAGRDQRNTLVTMNLSGSGWPLAACAGLAAAAVAYAWWHRRQRGWMERAAGDVAGAVGRIPASQRKVLLDRLDGSMRHEGRWKRFLRGRGLLVNRKAP